MDARDRENSAGKAEAKKCVIEIELPLPHISLHPNARPHWGTKARMTKRARGEAALVGKMQRPKSCPWDEATVHMTFHMPRKHDPGNLIAWMKASFDGLQDAQVILNDSGLHIGRVEQVIQRKERKVVLVIERD